MHSQLYQVRPGDLVVAPPKMRDSRFQNTVIMITNQTKGSKFGLCLNRPTRHTVQDLAHEQPLITGHDFTLYWGGPVNPQTIWMLHSSEWAVPETHAITDHWSMTSSMNMFHQLDEGDLPQHFRICYGFCAWAPEQLEAEIEARHPWQSQNSWLVWHQPHDQQILDVEEDQLWRVATEQCSIQTVATWL